MLIQTSKLRLFRNPDFLWAPVLYEKWDRNLPSYFRHKLAMLLHYADSTHFKNMFGHLILTNCFVFSLFIIVSIFCLYWVTPKRWSIYGSNTNEKTYPHWHCKQKSVHTHIRTVRVVSINKPLKQHINVSASHIQAVIASRPGIITSRHTLRHHHIQAVMTPHPSTHWGIITSRLRMQS